MRGKQMGNTPHGNGLSPKMHKLRTHDSHPSKKIREKFFLLFRLIHAIIRFCDVKS